MARARTVLRPALRLAALTAAYVAAAWLGLSIAAVHGTVAPVWPPAGVAIAILTLGGSRFWPVVALGAFLANFVIAGNSPWVAAGIATGNILEALLGAAVLRRLGVRGELACVRDAVAILAVAAAAPLPSASGGVLSLALGGISPWASYPEIWLVWWVGDLMGVLIVTPLLLAWFGAPSPVSYPARPTEFGGALALAALLVGAAYLLGDLLAALEVSMLPPGALLFPPLVWAVLRLRPRETVLILAVASALSVLCTLAADTDGSIGRLVWLQMALFSVGGGSLLLLGALAERSRSMQALRDSEQRLAGMLGAAMDAFICIDAGQRIVLFNAAAEAIFRCRADEAMGTPVERFIPESFRAAHREHVRQFLAEGTTARAMGQLQTLWGRRADGEEFPIEASISKVFTAGTWLATVIVRDVGERLRAERALRESREQLAMALTAGRSGVFDWDIRSDAVKWSDEMLALYGLRREQFGGHYADWLACLLPEDRPERDAAVWGALRQADFAMEFRIRRRDNGEICWMHSRGQVFADAAGTPVRVVGINVDITERKRLEEALLHVNEDLERRVGERTAELARANEALLTSNEELRQFAFIASHDLQTPLRAITGCAQLLHKGYAGQLDARGEDLIGRLVRATHRLQVLIRDLLEYSDVETKARPFVPTDLQQVFREVLAMLAPVIAERGAEVHAEALPTVSGDRGQLAQLLANLIDNGLKYHGALPPRVEVSAERVGAGWRISVRDHGIGIAPEHQERIFDIFARLHTPQAYPGTGIGLAICRRIVERHGGRLWVESAPGAGSVFHFTLPDATPALAA